jgi:hypothetical protein
MIALLASRPLRRRNFAAIEIGRQLIRIGQGFHPVFDGSETKSHRLTGAQLSQMQALIEGARGHPREVMDGAGCPMGGRRQARFLPRSTPRSRESFVC